LFFGFENSRNKVGFYFGRGARFCFSTFDTIVAFWPHFIFLIIMVVGQETNNGYVSKSRKIVAL